MSNCSNHKKEVAGISDMKLLAEMIGDLHYKSLTLLLSHLSDKFLNDARKDMDGGRKQIAYCLIRASSHVNIARLEIKQAWKISKPFMKKEPISQSPNSKIQK